MVFRLQNQKEAVLSREYSHLLVEELGEGDTRLTVRRYLGQSRIPIVKESTLVDDQKRNWFVFSISLPDISQLILELIEKGIGTNIQGINARK
jgi:hypothetical protein